MEEVQYTPSLLSSASVESVVSSVAVIPFEFKVFNELFISSKRSSVRPLISLSDGRNHVKPLSVRSWQYFIAGIVSALRLYEVELSIIVQS